MIDYAGQQLGNYRLLRLLGQGGFAQVYLGEHIYLNTQAAIKVLQMQLGDDEHNSFLNEARTIAHLIHPHIVRTLEFGVERKIPYLIMDYAPKGSLRQYYSKGERLPLETVVSYVKQIAAALQYAHDQNVVHRDVNPRNILLGQNDEALLSDFGIALVIQGSTSQSTEGNVIGTVAYMAPEQIYGKPGPASDQYSLATVVYEWLCGDRPFHGSFTEIMTQQMMAPPPSILEQGVAIPAEVEEVVMIALSKASEERFTGVEAFAHALEQASQLENQGDAKSKPILLHPATLPIVTAPSSQDDGGETREEGHQYLTETNTKGDS